VQVLGGRSGQDNLHTHIPSGVIESQVKPGALRMSYEPIRSYSIQLTPKRRQGLLPVVARAGQASEDQTHMHFPLSAYLPPLAPACQLLIGINPAPPQNPQRFYVFLR